jgi:predicted ATPase/transcriptional regulator with XRE-family HTH domain
MNSEATMNATSSAFGTLLRQFRERAGLSQELLAERAGLSLRGISDLERGARTTPRLETVRMLADGLALDDAGRAALIATRNGTHGTASPASRQMSPLPLPSTRLFGRAVEIATIGDMLADPHQRLVTLVGPGGVGKTRLAVEAGYRLADAFPDGGVFAGLASLKTPELVLPTIAAALGAPDSGSSGLLDLLSVTLRDRTMLLVLDNFEQVVDAAPDVTSLLERCPALRILVTSRVFLNVQAETVIQVEPLAFPEDVRQSRLNDLAGMDAVALFCDRARAVDEDFMLSEDNVDAVVELVRRLQGLPLAIELAAARTRILPPDALLSRMERQLPLLIGGSRDVPERQQTMRNTIAWSYDLLSPTEQAIFRRLSIFRAGCTLEAAERVLATAGGLSDIDILDGLTSLVDSSLLQRRLPEGSPPRFVMLVAVREFGLEQLAAHGEEEATREAAYRTWYMDLASKAEPSVAPEGEAEWLELLENEHDNFRSAISWLVDQDRIQEALDLAGGLMFFWWIRGHYAEARGRYESLLRHPLGMEPTVARGRALIGLGLISLHQGDSERSLESLDEAIRILRRFGHQRYLSLALLCAGNTYLRTGRFDESEAHTRECLSIAVEIGAKGVEEPALGNMSIIASSRGDQEGARDILRQQVALARSIKEKWGLSLGLLHLGMYAMQDGDLDLAEAQVEEATQLIIELKDRHDLPNAYWTLAEIARLRGDLDKATSMLKQALDVSRDVGDMLIMAQCLAALGRLAHVRGDVEKALHLSRQAVREFRSIGNDVSAVECLLIVADVATSAGDGTHAARCVGAVDRVLKERKAARSEFSPGEHKARVDALVRMLGEPGWRKHWTEGFGQDLDLALGTGLAWSPPHGEDVNREVREAQGPARNRSSV